MANSDAVFLNTPPGVLSYAWLNRRDTKYAKNGDEGVFRFTITFDLTQEKSKAFLKYLTEFAAENFPPKAIGRNTFYKTPKEQKDGDLFGWGFHVDKAENQLILKLSSGFEIPMFDAHGRAIAQSTPVGSGSVAIVNLKVEPRRTSPGLRIWPQKISIGKLVLFEAGGHDTMPDLSAEFGDAVDDGDMFSADEATARPGFEGVDFDAFDDDGQDEDSLHAAEDLDDDLPF
ncbi:MAG: hypothetical protein KDG54_15165 [Geminicoccaceae bacterium]|nr:hypothetical protein [Geminicoccaceae bacterium]